MAKLNSTTLIILSIFLLAVPGMIYNNMNNNGLVVSQATGLICSSDTTGATPTCQISGNVGCQVAQANCNLSGSSISFLNGASPFTQVLGGNIFALFTAVNGPGYSGAGAQTTPLGQSHGPYDQLTGQVGGSFYQANCVGNPTVPGSGKQTNWIPTSCTQANTDNSNVTQSKAATWTNWNTAFSGVTKTLQFFHLTGNATHGFSCNWEFQINYTALSNGPGFTYWGCDLYKGTMNSSVITTPRWSVWVAMPVNIGAPPAGNSHQFLFVALMNWDSFECLASQSAAGSVTKFGSPQCTNFVGTFKGVQLPFFPQNVSFVPNGAVATVFGFIGGIILFLIGLGLTVGFGGGLHLGVNEQGSKLAQSLGLALIIWSFLYSQFSTWFTSGILPYGLDGSFGVVGAALTGMFFFGFVWRSQSYE